MKAIIRTYLKEYFVFRSEIEVYIDLILDSHINEGKHSREKSNS